MRDRLKTVVVVFVVGLAVARLFCAARAELLPEEAYYWTYFQHPAASYFDHPPMVAWVIGLGTRLLGDTELGVRLGTIILSLMSCGLLYALGRIWFGQKAGLWAALLFTVVPLFIGTGALAFPDGPLVFFWLLTMYAVSMAVHPNGVGQQPLTGGRQGHARSRYWMLAGVAFGGALLSKYTAVMLGPSLLLFLLLSREHRGWLKRPEPWLALVLALVIFSPVILWNAQHDWASFRFQTSRTAGQNTQPIRNALLFWAFQAGVLTPPVFILFVAAAARAVRRGWWQREDNWNFAAAFFLPMFLVFLRASFKTNVHINWTAPAYLSLSLAAAALLGEKQPGRVWSWKWIRPTIVSVAAVASLLMLISLTWGVPRVFAYTHAGGWRELGHVVEAAEQELQARTGMHVFTLGADKYDLAAELGFYTHEPQDQVNPYALGKQGLGYRYWTDLHKFDGHPMITVFNKVKEQSLTTALAALREHFDHIDEPRLVQVSAGGGRTRSFYIVACYGYRASLPTQQPPENQLQQL